MDAKETLDREYQSYAGDSGDIRPDDISAYAALVGVFGAGMAASLLAAARWDRLPERTSVYDLALAGIATHKISRIMTRDRITSFLRAPFTQYEESAQINEVNEAPRGTGIRKALGELLGCPLCLGAWIAGSFTVGTVFAPRTTRAVATTFTTLAMSDFLHLAYVKGANAAE
jgi:hypothetical protein